jgi:hypothetical protein
LRRNVHRTFTHASSRLTNTFNAIFQAQPVSTFSCLFAKTPQYSTRRQGIHTWCTPHYEPSPAPRPVNNNTTPHATPRDHMSRCATASLSSFLTTEAQHSVRIRPKHHCIQDRRAYRVSTISSAAMPEGHSSISAQI